MTASENPFVIDYLQRLRESLVGLDRTRRDEIVDAVTQHVTDAWFELDDEGETAVRLMLEQLGAPEDIAAAARSEDEVPLAEPRSKRRGLYALGIAGGIAVVLVVVFAFVISPSPRPQLSSQSPTGKQPNVVHRIVTVPNVVGVSAQQATRTLSEAGFVATSVVAVTQNGAVRAGAVVAQTPAMGTSVPEGSRVFISVSSPQAAAGSTTTTIVP